MNEKFKVTIQVIEECSGEVPVTEIPITTRYEIEFSNISEAISALHVAKDQLVMRAMLEPVTGEDSRD